MIYKCKLVGVVSKERTRTYPCWPRGVGSRSPRCMVLSICVWFVAPDMVNLLWVSAEVKWGSVVLCGFWLARVKLQNSYFYNDTHSLRLQI